MVWGGFGSCGENPNGSKTATGMGQGPTALATYPWQVPWKRHAGRSEERIFEETSGSCFRIVRCKNPPPSPRTKSPLPLTVVGMIHLVPGTDAKRLVMGGVIPSLQASPGWYQRPACLGSRQLQLNCWWAEQEAEISCHCKCLWGSWHRDGLLLQCQS